MYVDNNNKTYAIQPIEKEEYDNVIIKGQRVEINQLEFNDYNRYEAIDDSMIITMLLEDYKYIIKNDLESAYNKLDKEYRNLKFSNIGQYEQYIKNSGINNAKLNRYKKTITDEYIQYVGIDENGNYYIFRESSAMNYIVFLDTYTVDLPEFLEKYEVSSESQKVLLNIKKVIDAINNKDYEYVYNKLDNTFKQNNFQNKEAFEKYIKSTLYQKNKFSYSNYQNGNNLHIYDIKITDETLANQTQINKRIIMKILEGTDFVMSFSVE